VSAAVVLGYGGERTALSGAVVYLTACGKIGLEVALQSLRQRAQFGIG